MSPEDSTIMAPYIRNPPAGLYLREGIGYYLCGSQGSSEMAFARAQMALDKSITNAFGQCIIEQADSRTRPDRLSLALKVWPAVRGNRGAYLKFRRLKPEYCSHRC